MAVPALTRALSQVVTAICSAAEAAATSPVGRVATLRLCAMLEYMLRHFDALPAHLMGQLHALLHAPPTGRACSWQHTAPRLVTAACTRSAPWD